MPTYVPAAGTSNIPNASKMNAIKLISGTDGGNIIYRWVVSEYTTAQIADGSFRYASYAPNYCYPTTYGTNVTISINGQAFTVNGGTFTGDATATLTGEVVGYPFRCITDNKEFINGVEWFRQVQTWSYKDAWVTE
jgi:hypothetical protein